MSTSSLATKNIFAGLILSLTCTTALSAIVVDESYSAQGFRRFEVSSQGFKNLCRENQGAGATIIEAGKITYFCTVSVFTQKELTDQGLAQVNLGPSLLNSVEADQINVRYLRRGIRFDVLPYDWYLRPYSDPSPAPIKQLQTNELQLRVVCDLNKGCSAANLQDAVKDNTIKTFMYQIDLFADRSKNNGDFDPNNPCQFGCGG